MRNVRPLLSISSALFLVICGKAQPANDNPCGAITLTVNATCVNFGVAPSTATATNTTGVPAPGCANYQNRDVWYKLTVPANGAVSIQTTAGGITDGGMAAYTATACGGTFTLVQCNDDFGASTMPRLDLTCLTPGSTLYIRFWRKGNGAGGTFNICASTLTPPATPANDDPCGAIALTAAASCTPVAGTTVGACPTTAVANPSCDNYSGGDTWYKVTTASPGSLTVTTTANSITDGAMAIYSATACNGTFTELDCDDNSGAGSMPQIALTCIPAGTYYIRFWQSGGGTGTFNICAVFLAVPSNDDPCGAVALPAAASCTYVAGTTVGACNTSGIPAPGCGSYGGSDVWYTLTTPSFGSSTITTTAGSITDGALAVYTATACNGTYTLVACDDDSGPGAMPAITLSCRAANTFYIRVWQYGGGTGTFNICATFTATSGVPGNDDPCSATALTVGTSCSTTAGTNVCATNNASPTSPGCGGFTTGSSLDVWYSFVAPSSGIGIIEVGSGTLSDPSMALYSGTCTTLAFMECDADDGAGSLPVIYRTDLTPGATYYVRVWGNGSSSGTFTICVRAPAQPSGYSCALRIDLFDTGGDGWGTSQISVTINGGAATAYTCAGAYNALLIGVNIGDVINVSYSNTGANQAENSYRIILSTSSLPYYNSGSPPANGLAFTQTVNCLPPMQSQEDCLGAKTLCGGASVNANPQSTGNVSDLFGSNYGCLLNAERQGLWYIFRMSNGGNVGMTVDPAANDDYDWAIWGPYADASTTSMVCSPAGAPARCSYASGPNTFSATGDYNTGMGSSAYSGSPRFDLPSNPSSQGAGGNGWVKGMTTVTGEIYLLYISNWSRSGLSFDLSWQLSNGASLDCTVLPVEFLSLSAEADRDAVNVNWTTLSESHSDHFVVERSKDAESFDPIGSIEAAGTSTHRIDYIFRDPHPLAGANYYRLKQIDIDGAYEYTDVVVVFFGPKLEAPRIFPDPVDDLMNIAFEMPASGTAYLQVLDASGRVVRDKDVDLDRGANTVSMNLASLLTGTYELRLFTTPDQPPRTTRFIKQ